MTLREALKDYYDPLFRGWTRRGVSFCVPVLGGLGWAIPDAVGGDESVAGVGLFRGIEDVEAIDYDTCVGMALGKAAKVAERIALFTRPVSSWLVYDLRAINGSGVIGDPGRSIVRIKTDATGKMLTIPNPPSFVSAEPLTVGRARVRVGYDPGGQAVAPTDLQVFLLQVADPTDLSDLTGLYDTPAEDEETGLTTQPYVPGKSVYTWIVPKDADAYYVFAAKFRNALGVGDGNDVISDAIECSSATPSETVDFALV